MRPVILIWRPTKGLASLWGPEYITATNFSLKIPVSLTATEILSFVDVDYYNQVPLNIGKNEILTFLNEDVLFDVPQKLSIKPSLTFLNNDNFKTVPQKLSIKPSLTFLNNDNFKTVPQKLSIKPSLTFVSIDYFQKTPVTITKPRAETCFVDIDFLRSISEITSLQKNKIDETFISYDFLRSISEITSLQKNKIDETFISYDYFRSISEITSLQKNKIDETFISYDFFTETPAAFKIDQENKTFVCYDYFISLPNNFNIKSSNEFLSFNYLSQISTSFVKQDILAIRSFHSNQSNLSISTDISFEKSGNLTVNTFNATKTNPDIPVSFFIEPVNVVIPPLQGPETQSSTAPDLFFYKNALHLKFEGSDQQNTVTELGGRSLMSTGTLLYNSSRFVNDQNNLKTKAVKTVTRDAYIKVDILEKTLTNKSASLDPASADRTLQIRVNDIHSVADFSPFSSNFGTSIYFDGKIEDFDLGSYVEVNCGPRSYNPTPSPFPISATDTATYEFWVYPKPLNSNFQNTIFSNYDGVFDPKHVCSISAAGNSIIYFENSSDVFPPSVYVSTPAGSIQSNTWTHVAIIRKSTTPYVKIFINGTLSAQTSTGVLQSLNSFDTNFLIGRRGISADYYFRGYLSNFRFVKGVEVYTSNFIVPKTHLLPIPGTELLLFQDDETDDLDLAKSDFTVEGWWNPLILYGGGGLVSIWGYETPYANKNGELEARSSWAVTQGSDPSQLTFSISDGRTIKKFESVKNDSEHESFVKLGWYHWAIVRRNNMIRCFINGRNVDSFTGFFDGLIKQPKSFNNSSLYISKENFLNDEFESSFGYFDDIRITRGVARYYENFIPPRQTSIEPPILPLHLLHFDDTSSMQLIDQMQSDWSYYSVGSAQSSATIVSSAAAFGNGGLYVAGGGGIQTVGSIRNILGGDFAIEMWINPLSFNNDSVNTIISQNLDTDTGFTLYITPSTIEFSYHDDGIYQASTSFVANSWYNIAVQRKNTNHLFFVNGKKLIPSGSGNRFSTASSTLYVGAYTAENVSFNGYIDELRISNFAKFVEDYNLPALAFSEKINEEDIITKNLKLYFDPSNSFSYDRSNYGIANNVVKDDSEMVLAGTYGHNYVHATSNAFSFSCAESDGTSTYIMSEDIDIELQGDFSIEMWLKADELSNTTYSYSSTNLTLPATISTNAPTALPNVWDHIVLTRNNGTVAGYKNSILWGNGTDRSNISDIMFGSMIPGSNIDVGLLRMYNRSLSTSEITQNYNAQRDRFYKPEFLIKLNYEEFPNIFDTSAYNYPINRIGSVTVTSTDYKVGLSSLSIPNSSSGLYYEKGVVKPLEISDFTFETWFKQTNFTSTQAQYIICSCSDPTSPLEDASDLSFSLEPVGDAWLPKFSVRYNGTVTSVIGEIIVKQDKWNNVAVTRSGSTFRAFYNGLMFATLDNISPNFYNSSWHIGNFYKQVGGSRLSLIGSMDDTKLLKNLCLYTDSYSIPGEEVILPITLTGSADNELDIFLLGQIGENSFFTRFISPLDVKLKSSSLESTGVSVVLSVYMPDNYAPYEFPIIANGLSNSGEFAITSAYAPDENNASELPIIISSLLTSGDSAILSFYSPDENAPSELPVVLMPAN